MKKAAKIAAFAVIVRVGWAVLKIVPFELTRREDYPEHYP